MTAAGMSAEAVIETLGLAPHHEGGHYRETFRDTPAVGASRAASTAIYFLLREGEVSRWHRVDAVEVWHWYAGAPLRLSVCEPNRLAPEHRTDVVLGQRLDRGERPQAIVHAGWWQQAESLGPWTLVGCTVAPGFEFAGFEMAPDPTGA